MAYRIDNERRPSVDPADTMDPHWSRAVTFSGWVALVFYALAIIFGLLFFGGEAGSAMGAAALSCLAVGAALGALSRMIRILRDIRDSGGPR